MFSLRKNCTVLMQPYVSLLTVMRISSERKRKHLLHHAPYAPLHEFFSYSVLWIIIYAQMMQQTVAGLSCFSETIFFIVQQAEANRQMYRQTDREAGRQSQETLSCCCIKWYLTIKNFQTIILIVLYIFIHPFTLNYKHIKKDKRVKTSS